MWSIWSQGSCCSTPETLQSPEICSSSPHSSSHIKEHSLLFQPSLKFAANFWYACSGAWLVLVPGVNVHCIALKRLENSNFNLSFIIPFQLRCRKKHIDSKPARIEDFIRAADPSLAARNVKEISNCTEEPHLLITGSEEPSIKWGFIPPCLVSMQDGVSHTVQGGSCCSITSYIPISCISALRALNSSGAFGACPACVEAPSSCPIGPPKHIHPNCLCHPTLPELQARRPLLTIVCIAYTHLSFLVHPGNLHPSLCLGRTPHLLNATPLLLTRATFQDNFVKGKISNLHRMSNKSI